MGNKSSRPIYTPPDLSISYDLENYIDKDREIFISYIHSCTYHILIPNNSTILIYIFSEFKNIKKDITPYMLYEIYSRYDEENKRKLAKLKEEKRIAYLIMVYHLRINKVSDKIKGRPDGVYCKYGYVRYA